MDMPRSEYPRPSFARETWQCLNGWWDFEIDPGDSGLERGLLQAAYSQKICVPFCPESPLSGIGNTDFLHAVWYRRRITVPRDWPHGRVLLHFQAVDYDTTIWVDGRQVARHRGGFTPVTCELRAVTPGQMLNVVVRARDDHRQIKPVGKQSNRFENYSCRYTRTTGIWQSVWMEPVSEVAYLQRPRITPNRTGGRFDLQLPIRGDRFGLRVRARLLDDQGLVSEVEAAVHDFQPAVSLEVPADRLRLWGPDDPWLYDIAIDLVDAQGQVLDAARAYAGMRSVAIDGKAVRLNDEILFQRLVLDQGYYPDGIMTAPSDAALVRDIELALQAGFNGARLHQKVFEERFLYHADRLGYLVWAEFGDWTWSIYLPENIDAVQPNQAWITQWLEVLERDYSHPSIIGWAPMNESAAPLEDRITALDDVMRGMFLATKAFDQTRPVLDSSGYAHRLPESDIWDCHDYEQDPETFRRNHAGLAEGRPWRNDNLFKETWDIDYGGQPFFVSEFGGAWWNPKAAAGEASWGYGQNPASEDAFLDRFEKLCGILLDDPQMFGYCYTQLTDVYQEQNGLFFFDRSPKFDSARLAACQRRPAAIEAGALLQAHA